MLAPRKLLARNRALGASAPVSGFGQTGNPYEELGVTTVINCEGTMTMLGGSLPHAELEAVMTMAGRHFVSMPELEVAAGKRIAEMLKLPEGYTRAGDVGRGGGDSIRSGGHSDGRERGLNPAIAGSYRHEVGSDHPEIASQSRLITSCGPRESSSSRSKPLINCELR